MRNHKTLVALAALITCAPFARAQAPIARQPQFMALGATAGGVGFTAGRASQAAIGGYLYVAFQRLVLGAQGGGTTSAAPDVLYGMATLGYPARVVRESFVYPFVGAGHGVLHSSTSPRRRTAVFGAGVGADQVLDRDGFGLLVGFRGGYLFRRGDVGERAIYFNLALGVGGRRVPEEKPPVIVAQRIRAIQ